MSVGERIIAIKSELPARVKLVAVSKTKPNEDILDAYRAGQRIFGENKVQEMTSKYEALPKDIEWHMIGHLQTNKVKYIVPFVSLIHSVDSLKLLSAVDKEAEKFNRQVPCLLQFHIATEETKFGLSIEEAHELLASEEYKKMKHVCLFGVMGMATFTEDEEKVRSEFSYLRTIFTQLKKQYFEGDNRFCEISMGMSDDYHIAIEEGSTLVRLGSTLFGARKYV